MQPVTPDRAWPLLDVQATRHAEAQAAAALPAHALMQRAGLAVARLALAVAPHARRVWVACGPGNNGGDGLEAAVHLHAWGNQVQLTVAGDPARFPPDAAAAWARAQAAGLPVVGGPPADWDLAIDALLGIGSRRVLDGALAHAARALQAGPRPVLAVDLPSGLDADRGTGAAVRASHTLALLALKPGLFTAGGRDAAGEIWFDDLGVPVPPAPTAWLAGPPPATGRPHASHKGSWGDVAVLGGAPGMAGAAVLAAVAALHAGAGRVFLAALDPALGPVVPGWPELMRRDAAALALERLAVACGCGGGEAVGPWLPDVLARAQALVLDADALNAVAATPALQDALRARAGRPTVLTPHPLEAARLLGSTVAQVQADRLAAAQALADRHACVAVLKGSGTVVATPGGAPWLNPSGNARLATGGTGDVLAGLLAARLASGLEAGEAARAAVWAHGAAADAWPAGRALTAGALAQALQP